MTTDKKEKESAQKIATVLRETLERGNWRPKMTISMISEHEIADRVLLSELEKTNAFRTSEFTARTVPNFQGGTTVLVTRHKL